VEETAPKVTSIFISSSSGSVTDLSLASYASHFIPFNFTPVISTAGFSIIETKCFEFDLFPLRWKKRVAGLWVT